MSLQADMDVCLQSFWGMFLMCDRNPIRTYHTDQPGAAPPLRGPPQRWRLCVRRGTPVSAYHSCGQCRIMGCANSVALFREGTWASTRGWTTHIRSRWTSRNGTGQRVDKGPATGLPRPFPFCAALTRESCLGGRVLGRRLSLQQVMCSVTFSQMRAAGFF